ncbi:GNAT family N-acetyltransferase [Mesorhizobium sp.]|uniref:GNAT family N-acetyltransferase n=1 Tax=Mesorhizobium sp. TaxID=1871066 RepID=UPI000FE87775|nr:GNAT family N-acetyltransferase [Mesorhizobium sp.]RWM07974.1 MAG: N-acetyltransferase [Mesorhizobium sp.]
MTTRTTDAAIEISSARTLVRPFEPGDAPEVFACISPEITRFMAWEPPPSLEDFEEVWRTWIPSIEDRSDLHLVARARKDGRCLGIVGVHAVRSGKPELGIWLRRDVHGLGYGRELIGSVAAWASKHLRVEYFEYPVAEENDASRRIAEAIGGRIAERRTNPKYHSVVYHIPPVA